MSTPPHPPPRRPPILPSSDDREQRVTRARAELDRRGMLRASTDLDPGVERDPTGRPTGRRKPPRPHGGIAIVGYRRRRPGDSTSEDEPPRIARPDGSYDDEPTGPIPVLDEVDERADEGEIDMREPVPSRGAKGAPGSVRARAFFREITEPGADPIAVTRDAVRVYLQHRDVACVLALIVALSVLAGIGVAALVFAAAVVRSPT